MQDMLIKLIVQVILSLNWWFDNFRRFQKINLFKISYSKSIGLERCLLTCNRKIQTLQQQWFQQWKQCESNSWSNSSLTFLDITLLAKFELKIFNRITSVFLRVFDNLFFNIPVADILFFPWFSTILTHCCHIHFT